MVLTEFGIVVIKYMYGEKMNTELLVELYGKEILEESKEFLEYISNKLSPVEMNIIDLCDCNSDFYVDSPDGFVRVNQLISKGVYDIYCVIFDDNTAIYGSEFHMFENIYGGYVSISNLDSTQKIKSKDGFKTVKCVHNTNIKDYVFDLIIDSENHRYYANDLVSHNSGGGKSLFLQNIAVNWANKGLNVVYLTLELSEKLCAMRIDAMHTNYDTKEVMKNIDEVHLKIRAAQQKSNGSLRIKQLPNGCTANDIRAYIKEYEIDCGKKVDAILIDYLDLMMPVSKSISSENLFVKDKYTTEELRNLAVELDVLMVSASQLNRNSYDEIEFDPSHIAGGISKVNTADNVIGIFTSAAMRESGRYQIQFMKTRSSSGVGSKVDLSFDTKSLRISDLDSKDDDAITATTKSTLDILKRNSVIKSSDKIDPKTGEILSNTQQTMKSNTIDSAASLRNMLKKI
jgi:hypothetical protein